MRQPNRLGRTFCLRVRVATVRFCEHRKVGLFRLRKPAISVACQPGLDRIGDPFNRLRFEPPRSGRNGQTRQTTSGEMRRSGVAPGRPLLQSERRIARRIGLVGTPRRRQAIGTAFIESRVWILDGGLLLCRLLGRRRDRLTRIKRRSLPSRSIVLTFRRGGALELRRVTRRTFRRARGSLLVALASFESRRRRLAWRR